MIKNFDLSGWTCFSERRNSKSYMSADKKWMVKFGTEFAPNTIESLEKDKKLSEMAIEIGVKTPKVGEIVELPDGTLGLIYEYMEGKTSIARAAGADTDHLDMYMKRFACIAKDMHSKVCDPNKFESMEERIRHEITSRNILNASQKERALKLLDSVEKKNNCLLGDCQHGNFIMVGDKEYVIDLGALGYGNPDYDIANFYYFCHYFPSYVTDRLFHCEPKFLPLFWDGFVRHYFDTNDEKVVEELTNKYKKLALVSFHGQFKFVNPDKEIDDAVAAYFDKLIQ